MAERKLRPSLMIVFFAASILSACSPSQPGKFDPTDRDNRQQTKAPDYSSRPARSASRQPSARPVQRSQIAAVDPMTKRCTDLGARTNDQMFQCKMMLEQRRVQRIDAIGSAASALGAALLAPRPQPTYQPPPPIVFNPPPVYCNTRQVGNQLRTICQ